MSSLLLQSSSVEPGVFGVTLVLGSATGRTEKPYDRYSLYCGITKYEYKTIKEPWRVSYGTADQ